MRGSFDVSPLVVLLRLIQLAKIFKRFPKVQMQRGKEFRYGFVVDPVRTIHRFLVPVEGSRSTRLMTRNVMGSDAMLKIVRTLCPRLLEEFRGLLEVSFALLLHSLRTEFDDGIVRVHGSA